MPTPGHDDPRPGADPDDHESQAPSARGNIAALVFVGLLFLGAYWVFEQLRYERNLQNCIDSGRRNCVDLTGAARP